MATHKELITALKFDESFKNALRDYYSYGFKGLNSYDPMRVETLKKDWERLNNILYDYMEWSEKSERGTIMYALQDSQAMSENPFHRLYRFCKFNHSDPMCFFNIIFALSDDIAIAGKGDTNLYDRLGINLIREAKKRSYYKYIAFFKKNYGKAIELRKKETHFTYELFADNKNVITVPHKDGDFVLKLYKYWDFINKHTNVFVSESGKLLVGCIGENREFLDMPCSNINDVEMVKKLVQSHGRVDLYEKVYLANTVEFLKDQFVLLAKSLSKRDGLSSSQLQCFYPSKIGIFTGDNNAINTKLKVLKQMGILQQIPDGGTKQKVGKNKWKLQAFVLEDILEEGQKINPDFETAFYTAIDFFTRYFILGACGTFIQDRMGSEDRSPFRFKHEYFIQALNDFNLIDLLHVIENNKWCEVQYRHGTAEFSTTLLCKPIELRVSSATGRQFLVFYNPIKRSCTNLRLEFIEKITCYDEKSVLKALEKSGISEENIKSDIQNALHSIKYFWGVSASEQQEYNVVAPVEFKTVQFQISYKKDKEYFIAERIYREARDKTAQVGIKKQEKDGKINFIAQVSDPKEMRPWIRSMYSRILSSNGLETEGFSMAADIEKCIRGIEKLEKENLPAPKRWLPGEATIVYLKNGEKVRAHEELFNEIFSVYYYMIAEVILQCCSIYKGQYVSEKNINDIVKTVQGWFEQKKGIKTDTLLKEEIKWLIQNNAFGKSKVKSGAAEIRFKYECDSALEFYRNILPLTRLEIRWLKTILDDPQIKCFLSEKESNTVKELLDQKYPDIEKLPMDKIIFYDRHSVFPEIKDAEGRWIPLITKAIYKEELLDLSYTTRSGSELFGKFKPIVLEFSKRNDKFQACFQSCRNNRFYYINIAQINNITMSHERFDYYEALGLYERYRKENERSVKIEFYNIRNRTDRLLTEFSPWKKYCTYNADTGVYSLEIFYQKTDEAELIVRLMSHGAGIHFVDKNHNIPREILARLQRQRDMIREQNQRDI